MSPAGADSHQQCATSVPRRLRRRRSAAGLEGHRAAGTRPRQRRASTSSRPRSGRHRPHPRAGVVDGRQRRAAVCRATHGHPQRRIAAPTPWTCRSST